MNNALTDVAGKLGIALSDPAATKPQPPAAEPVSRRPRILASMVGQDRARTQLGIHLAAAKERGEPPGHVLFTGPAGVGKTSLAEIVAWETGGTLVRASAASVNTPKNMARKLATLSAGDVLALDEIHGLSTITGETLYSALEDGRIEFITGGGTRSEVVSLDLEPFCLVGATTELGKVAHPLLTRFSRVIELEYYTDDQLAEIILGFALAEDADITEDACLEVGRRSRGVARQARSLFAAARDYATVHGDGVITADVVEAAMTIEQIDCLGLTRADAGVLLALCATLRGGPVGPKNLANTAGAKVNTVVEVIEPWLVRQGLVVLSPRGRVATHKAYDHLNRTNPDLNLRAPADLAWG